MRAVRFAALLLVLVLAAPTVATLPGPDPSQAALGRALAYLEGQADKGGEYLVEAVAGAGLDPGLWPTPAANVLDRLTVPPVGAPNDPIREIHSVAQSGYDPRGFQGRDLVAELKAAWEASLQGVGQASFTVLALHAAGVPSEDATIQETVSLLQRGQYANGGWSCWGLPSPDCTGFALTALAAADGFLPGMAERARLWLDANRLANGGYASGGHIGSLTVAGVSLVDAEGGNTQSTIWAVNGYRALGDPAPAASMAYLLSRQMPDGGFAWRDADTRSDPWSTMEVVAGWKQAFHQLPVFAPATVVAPPQATVGLPATFGLAGFDEVAWTSGAEGIAGPAAQFTFPATGTATVHVDARRAGAHHRETVTTAVGNAAPAFPGLPAEVSVARHGELRLDPAASDPDGHAVTVTWTFGDRSGTGAVAVTPTRRGDVPLVLTATDAHGAATTATVLVHVTK